MQTIYLAPLSHYDVAWAFTKEDYLDINEGILQSVVEFMKKYEEYKFSWEQVFPLEVLERRNPGLWAEIKEMIQKGKLEIVDGQYLMPDTMLPAGEVLVREILFGKRYCKEKFGMDVPVAWCADSFGMNAQLPQIYKRSGYKWVAFRRGAREMQSEFLWKGLDGTTILAHWMPLGYRAGFYLDKLKESYIELNKYATTFNILMPSGSGSTPPQEEVIEAVKQWNKEHLGESQMKIVVPSEFFRAVELEEEKLEVRSGELYDEALIEVFPQVCSSRAWIVMGARKCEGLLTAAEWFSTLAWLLGNDYPQDIISECWEKMLFVAFHDIITGCGIDEIYDDVREIFSFLEEHLTKLLNDCLKFIASQINTQGEAVVVFNPLPQKTKNWCEVDLKLQGWEKEPGLKFGEEEIETQVLSLKKDAQGRINSAKLGFFAELLPMGYKAYRLVERGKEPEWEIKVEGNKIENQFFRSLVNPETGIIEVFDKKERPLFKGNELNIENEVGDLYYHQYMFFELVKNESGDGIHYGVFKPEKFSIERGALKTKVILEEGYYCLRWPYRLFDKFGTKLHKNRVLDITKEIIIYRDSSRIEFVTRVKSKYPNIRLRVKFDTFKERMVYFRETQFGIVPEPTELSTSLEKTKIPAGIPTFLSWFDYGDGTRGITFMNKGIPANEIRGSNVYLTLLRSVGMLSADGRAGPMIPTPDALELNKNYTFEYALSPHEYDWRRAQVYKHSQEFQRRPLWVQVNSKGDLLLELSFLKLSPDNIILSALKKAEGGNEIVLRFYETKGEQTTAEIEFFHEISRCMVTDLLEQEEHELKLEQNKLRMEIKPFEIVTLKLTVFP
ncbi:glycoside hydrolase [candidate division NPL-UPA2 bacterium Unc8]|uniref:Glycoside hydrolase n=1 Tax=candidate division NPL-UPA2 bacterium Unc8 TaxID=1980939 RepID=A0A399FUL1_UNCN2|nr:Mannosylglycerate hydrolase [Bacillota bacterium]RII00068.1 MAG: glycoside hydrolase [candidate division NPL-UPA2 bacterium Unc8]